MRKLVLLHGTRDWAEITAPGQVSVVELASQKMDGVELCGLDYGAVRRICSVAGVVYLYGRSSDMPEVRVAKSRIEHLGVHYDFALNHHGDPLVNLTPRAAIERVLDGCCARRAEWATPCFIRRSPHPKMRHFIIEGGYAPDRWTPYVEDFARDDWCIVVPRSAGQATPPDVSQCGPDVVDARGVSTNEYARRLPIGEDDGTATDVLIEECGIEPQDLAQ